MSYQTILFGTRVNGERGDDVECLVWTNDGIGRKPDFLRRGHNRHMKNRKWKRDRMAAIHQRRLDDYAALYA